ncbi:MAG: 16S rRNA (adenine(1518)-N(6)/adenine(1519)-N(6))-dimethyltransferase RsmA, partial [bacterium]
DDVLEVGPGLGALTEVIVPEIKSFIAIEKDNGFASFLKEKFEIYNNFSIVNEDILNFNVSNYVGGASGSEQVLLRQGNLKIIGNLPYYITSPIIFHLLSFKQYIDSIYITVQKEVAERITAKPGTKDYGLLSCSVQYHTAVSLEFKLTKGSFYPIPNVDSAFVKLDVLKEPSVKVKDEELLFKIIRAAFQFRRKKLLNALLQSGSIPVSKEGLEAVFEKLSLDKNVRGEVLNLAQFALLADSLLFNISQK